MSQAVKLPAIFTKAETLTDNSVKLIFATRELGGTDVAQLFSMKGKEVWLLLAPDDSLDAVDVPKAKPDAGTNAKTPGQRQRAILFVWWKQLGSKGDFEEFYRQQIERVIDTIKSRLDSGDLL
jgi:hypothetical protein